MNEQTKAALQIILTETILKREQSQTMADQYKLRAKIIEEVEIPELNEKIRQIQADLE